ncbi:MAG: hypothetical protein CBC74_001590 [Crocinitomicaceae bacterium TMED114]|nr:MAG: hypothetical protein CBC74_001590 [Crocinitomicaceae bacterium TMED114]
MMKRSFLFLLPALIWTSCNEPEPVSRCVLDRVEVLSVDPDYFDDTLDEGLPDLFVELRNAATQAVLYTTGVAQEAAVPVTLDFVAVNIELADFQTDYEFTVFDEDEFTTQDFIALGLPFKVEDHVDAERAEVDLTDGSTTIRVHLIWY